MADHNINHRAIQCFHIKQWLGIAKFILERITAIIPKMKDFYLGGAQDSYRIISVHIEKLNRQILAATNEFLRPTATTTSTPVEELLKNLDNNELPPVVDTRMYEKRPLKKYDDFLYETKDNIIFHSYVYQKKIENPNYDPENPNGGPEYIWIDQPEKNHVEVYQSDQQEVGLAHMLKQHYKQYGPSSNPASIGRCSPDTKGLKAAKQPDYYLDPADINGFYTMTDNEKFRPVNGSVDHEIGDNYEGLYMFSEGIIDPAYVGGTRWYAPATCFIRQSDRFWTGINKDYSVQDNEGGWYTLRKQITQCRSHKVDYKDPWWGNTGVASNINVSYNWKRNDSAPNGSVETDHNRYGMHWDYGWAPSSTNVPHRQTGCDYVRFNFEVKLDKVKDGLFKNVDMGMLLHESPVDPDVYVFGYSYYKSMVRTLIYNLNGLKVSCNVQRWVGANGMPWSYTAIGYEGYSYQPTWANWGGDTTVVNPINVTSDQYRFLAPGKWATGYSSLILDSGSDMGKGPESTSTGDQGKYPGSPNQDLYGGYDDMDTAFLNVGCHVDIWKNFKGQAELNRYYYPMSQIYGDVDSTYNKRFLKVFGDADYNMVDLWSDKGSVYDHEPNKIKTLLDGKTIVPLYVEVLTQEMKDGALVDKEVNIHFSGGQETWFSPYFNWTFSVATLMVQTIQAVLDNAQLDTTTDMDVFNMYEKLKSYAGFFQQYSGVVVNILANAPLGGKGMASSGGTIDNRGGDSSAVPTPMSPRRKNRYRVKNRKGNTLHEFFAPFTSNS